MRLSFLIYSYFPYGGQQRDFLEIAKRCLDRGHEIDIYTLSWQGDIPERFNVKVVPIKALTRIGRYRKYTSWVTNFLRSREPSFVIGFNKMPGLDLYFAADSCFLEKAHKQRASYYRFTSRFNHFSNYENEVFGDDQNTEIMVLTAQQKEGFKRYYPGCNPRLHDLPPGISADRRLESRRENKRIEFRKRFRISESDLVLLQVGSGFKIKGVDRSLAAIASLPSELKARIKFILVGKDRPTHVLRIARRLGVSSLLTIVPGSNDIPSFLAGADLMIHPAYQESAGHVLLESTVSGLPVLTTYTCGYAYHIEKAESGLVCSEPFDQSELNQKLSVMLEEINSGAWSENGVVYGRENDLYSLHDRATDLIEKFAKTNL